MAILNPVYGLIVPFLFVFTVPLAIFAGITTTLAFSVLMFRVAVVYLDIAIRFVPQYIMGRSGYRAFPATYQYSHHKYDGTKDFISLPEGASSSGSGHNFPSPTLPFPPGIVYVAPGHRSPMRERAHSITAQSNGGGGTTSANTSGRRSRRPSQGSTTSVGTITPLKEAGESFVALSNSGFLPSTSIERDFEGVGGWRLDDRGDDSDWANINSRLELPLERLPRHHHRSPSGGASTTPGEGSWLMMKNTRKGGSPESLEREASSSSSGGKETISPNSSRIRVNQNFLAFTGMDRADGYFPPLSPKLGRKDS